MSEQPNPVEPAPTIDPEELVEYESYIRDGVSVIMEATAVLNGGTAPDSIERIDELLPKPPNKRDTTRQVAAMPELSPEGKDRLRNVAAYFGIGAEADASSFGPEEFSDGYVFLAEGGLAWKQEAQALLSCDGAVAIVHAGDPNRPVTDAERAFMAKEWKLTDEILDTIKTEYDIARRVASRRKGFVPKEDEVLPYGYEVAKDNPEVNAKTGQFVQIGTKDGKPIVLLRVDRETPGGSREFRPRTETLLRIVSNALAAENSQIGGVVATGNTYASRIPNTILAGLETGRKFGARLYGRETLRKVKGGDATDAPLNQIPGELGVYLRSLLRLQREVWKQAGFVVPETLEF